MSGNTGYQTQHSKAQEPGIYFEKHVSPCEYKENLWYFI